MNSFFWQVRDQTNFGEKSALDKEIDGRAFKNLENSKLYFYLRAACITK